MHFGPMHFGLTMIQIIDNPIDVTENLVIDATALVGSKWASTALQDLTCAIERCLKLSILRARTLHQVTRT